MKIIYGLTVLVLYVFNPANAAEDGFNLLLGLPYSEARQVLLNEGWRSVQNQKISYSSLYAQDVAQSGYPEVSDCISMERDQCTFALIKNRQKIIVTTKEKSLYVESIKYQKRLSK